MPPRIPISHVARCCRTSIERSTAPPRTAAPLAALFAGLSITKPQLSLSLSQSRNASILSDLRDNKGAYSKRIRKGRGASSGYGKTSGRGHKGQGQHGKVKPWFQGGQTPLIIKHGRMGFVNTGKEKMAEVNLTKLQTWIDGGRIDPSKPITPKELLKSRLVSRLPDGIKLLAHERWADLGDGPILKQPIDIMVSRASAKAIEAIEAAGGKVVTRYYTKAAIRNMVRGTAVNTGEPLPVGPEFVEGALQKAREGPYLYRLPDPTSRWHIEYYRDPAHRGYLSHLLKPGETPSLFFKVPGQEVKKKASQVKKVTKDKKLFELR